MNTDKRFSRILKDPRFKRMPRKAQRVMIDSRFKSMFSDSRFKTKYSVDKRGRPIRKTSKEDLKKFYNIDKEDTEKNGHVLNLTLEESDSESSGDDDIDFSDIRGGALSSSSSDEEDSFHEYENEDINHDWGELDKDAKRKTDAVTSRLAVCNMDWDKVTANDLFVLFSSFGGAVKSVKIYLSEFGKQRLAQEDLSGPIELRKENEEDIYDEEEEGDPNNVEGASFHMEKLRKYQLNRMKYYYAIADFESKEAANMIYENCDGIEYELAATRLDLRFVPDETEFDDEPTQVSTEAPMLSNYQPTVVTNSALQQSTVRLTWDETNPQRLEMTMRKFNKDELEDLDFKAYLATSSEEEEEGAIIDGGGQNDGGEEGSGDSDDGDSKEKDDEDERIKKYKSLLQEIESKGKNDDDDKHMEISWEPALSESAEKIVKNKIEKEQEKNITPWEKYLKDKKKKFKSKGKTERSSKDDSDIGENEEEAFEDASEREEQEEKEYIPAVADDPFFVHDDMDNEGKRRKDNKNRKKKGKKRREEDRKGNKPEDSQERSELELLLMDDKEEKRHFSMKEIMDNEKKTKKRRKGKLKSTENIDQFEIDVHDTRFSALFNSPDYILDPSDPQFKKTKAMDRIIEEKQKRRKFGGKELEKDAIDGSFATGSTSRINPSLSALVNVVKARTENFQQRKKFKSRG